MPNQVGFNPTLPSIEKSRALYERAKARIPAATQTLAKGPGQHVFGVAPIYLERGQGAHVWDVDGNEYIDFNMAIGPLSLGYTYPAVDAAIRKQLESGITFSLMHPLEVEVAELIHEVIPNAERVRFSKTGADVTSSAVRVARAFTGRTGIACCGYHGWHDWYISVTDRNRGIPEVIRNLTSSFIYNDIDSAAAAIDSNTAAVILEPVLFEPPKNDFLFKLKELCASRGALLIFDEMWTGFRLALGGAQEFFDIKADLSTYSKAIANGMPLSVLAGRADVMDLFDRDLFFYTTFGGEALSLAAAKATIEELRKENGPAKMAHLGKKLQDGYEALVQKLEMGYTHCVGYPARTLVTFAPQNGIDPLLMKSLVQQELIQRGILWTGFHVISLSHTEKDVEHTLSAYAEVLPILKDAVATGTVRQKLKGEPVQPVFRTTSGNLRKP